MAIELCKILPCDCKHEYQDAIYGKGKRVFNPAFSKGSKPNRYRCTCCKREVTLSTASTAKKEVKKA